MLLDELCIVSTHFRKQTIVASLESMHGIHYMNGGTCIEAFQMCSSVYSQALSFSMPDIRLSKKRSMSPIAQHKEKVSSQIETTKLIIDIHKPFNLLNQVF